MSRMSDYCIFCDESGQSHGSPCYTIGALTMPRGLIPQFDARIRKRREEFGIGPDMGELKWKKVKGERAIRYVNFITALFYDVLMHPDMRLHFIVVDKRRFNKWNMRGKREQAFYTTYNYLIGHASSHVRGTYAVLMDRRSDSYERWPEAMESIVNRLLGRRGGLGNVGHVEMVNSKKHPGVQLVDLFTGAVNAAHLLWIDQKAQMHPAKKIVMRCMARVLDWDHLGFDTFPVLRGSSTANELFNVWHFPKSARGPSQNAPVVDGLRQPKALTNVHFASAFEHPGIQHPYRRRRFSGLRPGTRACPQPVRR